MMLEKKKVGFQDLGLGSQLRCDVQAEGRLCIPAHPFGQCWQAQTECVGSLRESKGKIGWVADIYDNEEDGSEYVPVYLSSRDMYVNTSYLTCVPKVGSLSAWSRIVITS